MKGFTKVLASGVIVLASSATFANDFFNFSESDSKTFSSENGVESTVQVIDTSGNWKKFNQYLGKENQWIWSTSNSQVLGWYSENGDRQVLVNFEDTIGTTYNVDIDNCINQATIASKGQTVVTLAGTFSDTVELTFSGDRSCAAAGISSAIFARGIGLVSYSRPIYGNIAFETTRLTSAIIDDVEYPIFNGIEVSAKFPAGRVLNNHIDKVSAYLTIENKSDSAQAFTFNSSKLFDIVIFDSNGVEVNRWSANKRFLMALQNVEIAAGESRTFGGDISLVNINTGRSLDVGSYTIRIELAGTNKPEASAFDSVPFAVESPLYIDQRVSL
ncbi:BsuPI-related putative proteinase inhibitor [Pleionea sediminis]|uniref:BsuPI-related putative proteinase inhibitor n=1 Tax=Pleionea sediminis TaxID=2569479 RepID=UPI001184AC67|nr:BsuPI-related putative proteinase inhibitor [Pleionea sediminis]